MFFFNCLKVHPFREVLPDKADTRRFILKARPPRIQPHLRLKKFGFMIIATSSASTPNRREKMLKIVKPLLNL